MKDCHDCAHARHGDWGDADGPRYGCAHEKRRDITDWLHGFADFDDGLPTEDHCDGKPCPMWAEAPKPKPEPLGVLITREDLSKMLLHEVRYALGRLTWVSSDSRRRVKLFWPHIEPQTRKIIARDVREYVERLDRRGESLTLAAEIRIAADDWKPLLAWMEAQS